MNSIWYYLRDLLACFPAVIGYGIYMSVSKKPLLLSSACGTSLAGRSGILSSGPPLTKHHISEHHSGRSVPAPYPAQE